MDATRATSVQDLRLIARARLPRAVFDFVDGAACDERSARANVDDFAAVRFVPRFLRDVSSTSVATTLLGAPAAAPIAIAPTGLATLVHPDADRVLAREAAAAGIPFALSTASGTSLEDVAAVGPGRRWFQLYVFRDRSITERLIERAAAAGYEALVLTVDVPLVGKRDRDRRNGFTVPLRLTPSTVLDFALHPRWCLGLARHGMPTMRNYELGDLGGRSHAEVVGSLYDPSLTWEALAWLRARWRGPLLVKGLLALDDVLRAADLGADAVVVSNHGGRQLDGTSSSIRALADWGAQASARVPLLVDGGIRRGSDVVAAVALGARGVLIGRPGLYAVGAGGAPAVRRMLATLVEEMHLTLAHLGAASLAEVGRHCVETDPRR
ncbi:MAG: L-lactate cytochrome reductase LldA [Pseudomonadota bacterium]|jgi:(S)-mandelate dehydrogenase